MTDYSTIVINESTPFFIFRLAIILLVIFLSITLLNIIFSEIENGKRIRKENYLKKRDAPYVKEYQRLNDERKWKEARDYLDKHLKYIKNSLYM